MSNAQKQLKAWVAVGLFVAAVVSVLAAPLARADDAQDARQLVEKAGLTFESFLTDPQMGPDIQTLVQKAKGILIYPQVFRGGFIFGGAGGSGVFVVRSQENGNWVGPAFYALGGASVGLQAGADVSEGVLVALTDRGVAALLRMSVTLGASVSVAVGPVGGGAGAATANLSADLVSYTRNRGLYAGFSIEGAVVSPRDRLNWAYYETAVTPAQILIQSEVSNPHAARLLAAVSRGAGGFSTAHNPTAAAE